MDDSLMNNQVTDEAHLGRSGWFIDNWLVQVALRKCEGKPEDEMEEALRTILRVAYARGRVDAVADMRPQPTGSLEAINIGGELRLMRTQEV